MDSTDLYHVKQQFTLGTSIPWYSGIQTQCCVSQARTRASCVLHGCPLGLYAASKQTNACQNGKVRFGCQPHSTVLKLKPGAIAFAHFAMELARGPSKARRGGGIIDVFASFQGSCPRAFPDIHATSSTSNPLPTLYYAKCPYRSTTNIYLLDDTPRVKT